MQAQISITTLGSPVTQDFNGMGSSATATLPTGFRVSDATSYAGGTTATTQAAGTTGTGVLAVNSGGGTYNFANGVTASSTDRALGFLTSGGFSSPRSIMVAFQNNTGSTITQLSISFDYEKYRSGMRAFGWTFFSGTDGTNWTAQTDGDQAYAADANNMVVNNPPTEIAKSVTITGLSIANGTNYYLRWTFTGVSGSTNGQAIGIDDFSLTANGAPLVAAAALDFDGVNDIVSTSLPPVFNNLATNDFTMETWFKAGPSGGEPRRIVLAQQNSNNFTSILLSSSNSVFFYVVVGGTTYSTTAGLLPFNQWAHIAVRWTAATQTVEIFYNGVLQNYFNGGSSSFGTNNTFTFGNGTVLPHYFIGQLDEFRVWDKALSVTEINSRKDCEIAGSLPNLVMNYHFNQGNSGANNAAVTTLIDDSGNGYTGTLQNFALTGATSNWVAPGAVVTGTTCTCTMLTWYRDMDMDGFGNPAMTQMACLQPVGYVADNTDCDDNDPLEKPGQVWYADVDNDNYSSGTTLTQCLRPAGYKVASELTATTGDCNDGNAAINPAATEICDGVDNNCNMMTDEGVQTTYYRDMDGDGFGDPLVTQMACSQPMGYVTNNTDCDDNDALEKPGQVWYKDTDGDGYAQTGAATITQCLRPMGYKAASELTSTTGDCNDNNAAINPAATEICDGVDNNCNMMTDEGCTPAAALDFDGFDDRISAGLPPVFTNLAANDFTIETWVKRENTDTTGRIVMAQLDVNNFASLEVNSSGQFYFNVKSGGVIYSTRAGSITINQWHHVAARWTASTQSVEILINGVPQAYSNAFGSFASTENSTFTLGAIPRGGSAWGHLKGELDEFRVWNRALSNMEITDRMNCEINGSLTNLVMNYHFNQGFAAGNNTGVTTLIDDSGNGYTGTLQNFALTGASSNWVAPGGVTSGTTCPTCTPVTWYRDMDGDGFGNPSVTQMACIQPMGYVADNTDCNDNSALEKPGQVWYKDTDGDGYAQTGAATITQCLRPMGYKVASELTATSGDCNDNNAAINPAATEVCDGVDNNCNMMTDEGVQTTYYRDMDGDGFGNPAVTQMACTQPTGYVTNNTDCDDNDALEKPGQVWYKDTDGDNYAETGAATITQCLRPMGYKAASELTSTTGDCNDNNAAINPAATEVCDGVDNNCNMMTDEGVQTTYYRDMDGDGFGNPAVTQMACTQPMGYVTNNTDCDDNDALEKPGQVWYADLDNDGYSSGTTLTQCLRPVGYKVAAELTATTGDCNDGNPAINPAATEVCDGVDNNCNMMTDEGVQTTYYRDMDGDGFGNPSVTQMACTQPMGYVTNNTDCDDNDALEKPGQVWYADLDNDGYSSGTTLTQCLRPVGYKVAAELTATTGDCNDGNAAINPAATEICDGLDNNCNGQADEPQAIGGAWSSNDVGAGVNGSASVGCSNGSSVYNVSASGFSTSGSDKLHLVSQQLCGNGEIIARVLATNNAGWAGITLRESLMPGSRKVALKTQLSSMIRREIRTMTNAPVNMLNFNRPSHVWLRLTRSGSNFVGYTSMDGLIWDFAFSANVTMTGCIYAGIFAESINTNVETTASFDNVSITGGTPGFSANAPDFTPSLNGLEVSVYPNPSNGDMTLAVQSATDGSLNLTVVDALGRVVRNIELNEGAVFNYSLDLSKEAAGIYYLRLRSENGEANVQRIVITR